MKKFLPILLLVVVMVSCRNIKDPEFKRIEAIDLNTLNLNSPTIKVNVIYFNPNNFSAKLKEASGDAWVDTMLLGHFTVDSIIHAPANSEFVVPVNLAINMQKILQNSISLMSKEQVLLRLSGNAKAGKGGFYKNFPIQYQGMQNVQELFK